LEILEFLLSLSLSSLGVAMDLLTTSVFVRELGLEFEWNKRVKYIVGKWGFRVWILCLEIPMIVVIAFFDSTYSSSLLFVGLVWFIARGFAACINLRAIVLYRTIGVDKFKEQWKSRNVALRSASFSDKLKLGLPYLIGLIISLIIYILLNFASFSTVTLIKSLSLGLLIFFFIKVAQ